MSAKEKELIDRIGQMREAGEQNAALIDEAIRGIYFHLEEDPTNQKVLALVSVPGRSPSTGTVQKHINQFKADLRKRLRLNLSLPEIPEAARIQVEEAMSAVIQSCQLAANSSLELERNEMQQESDRVRRECNDALLRAKVEHEHLERTNQTLQESLTDAQSQVAALASELAELIKVNANLAATIETQGTQLADLREERSVLQRELTVTRDGYEARLSDQEKMHREAMEKTGQENKRLGSLLQEVEQKLTYARVEQRREADQRISLQQQLNKEQDRYADAIRESGRTQKALQDDIAAKAASLGELRGRWLAAQDQQKVLEGNNAMLQRENAKLLEQLAKANEALEQSKMARANKPAPKPKQPT